MSPAKAALRIALATAATLLVAQLAGHALLGALLMPLALITDTLSEVYTARVTWDPAATAMVRITAQLFDGPVALAPLGIYHGAEVKAAIHLEHTLLPVVLLYTVLGALLALALTAPFLLAGSIEMLLQERAAAVGVPRAEPAILRWMLFTEGGGRWLLAIVLALVIIAVVDVMMPARRER